MTQLLAFIIEWASRLAKNDLCDGFMERALAPLSAFVSCGPLQFDVRLAEAFASKAVPVVMVHCPPDSLQAFWRVHHRGESVIATCHEAPCLTKQSFISSSSA